MKFVVVWACLVAAAACHVVQPPAAPPRQSSLSLAISGLALPNGLRVVVVRDPTASEVSVTMRYRVGSVDDTAAHPGIAHLVEHLMFQQTLGSQSLFAHLEDAATEFNAFTSFDATTYIARAPRAKLDELLSIEAVRVGFRCTTITDAIFEREREVVVNELRQRDAADELRTALRDAVYPEGHPYRQPIGGSVDSVRAITRAQACAFEDAHYAPGNGVLVVSGNITPDEVVASLGKFLARVAKRDVAAPVIVKAVPDGGRKATAAAPIDDDALVVAWPMPTEPRARAEVDAIAEIAALAIDQEIAGRVETTMLGDVRAPMLAFVVKPGADETLDDLKTAVTRALDALPSKIGHTHSQVLGDLAFDVMQQGAIYREYSELESPSTRDAEIAQAVLDGNDPNDVLGATFAGLRELMPESAEHIARTHFSFDQATVIELTPTSKKLGHETSLAAAVHDVGLRRDQPDVAEAHEALPPAPSPLAAARTRTLPNGMKVVLLPLTSVPTVDIRLVFAAGTADEDPAHRGVAIAASRGLEFDLHYLNDLLLFAGAGGTQLVEPGTDTTTFEARGVDMHLDLLLAGLRRWVREGRYEEDDIADALRAQAKQAPDGGAAIDAWRTAMYGKDHPYVAAGLVRHIAHAVSLDDVRAFRAAHYTPDNATLVIAGRFDAALADQWIDFLFADWKGHAVNRQAPRAQPAIASLALFRNTAQVGMSVVLPATTGTRAARLVAGEMLEEIADDVRHQLGATYGLDAAYNEQRLAGEYALVGWVDPARTADAVQLVRDRLAALRAAPEAAFVVARRRVVAHLDSLATTGAGLASRVEQAIATDQPPLGDVETTAAVRALKVDDVVPVLADLDFARASLLLSGPEADVRHAFEATGRTPTVVQNDRAKDEEVPVAHITHHDRETLHDSDLEPAITEQGAPSKLALTAGIGLAEDNAIEPSDRLHYDCCNGYMVFAEAGYRYDARHAVGLHLGYGGASGHYGMDSMDLTVPMTLRAIDANAFIQASAYGRFWASFMLGVHLDDIAGKDQPLQGWGAGLDIGVEGGVDLVKLGLDGLGLYVQLGGTLLTSSGYGSIAFGAAYRR